MPRGRKVPRSVSMPRGCVTWRQTVPTVGTAEMHAEACGKRNTMKNEITFKDAKFPVLWDRITLWEGKSAWERSLVLDLGAGVSADVRVDVAATRFKWEQPVDKWSTVTQKLDKIVQRRLVKMLLDALPIVLLKGEWVLVYGSKEGAMPHLFPRANTGMSWTGDWAARTALPQETLDLPAL